MPNLRYFSTRLHSLEEELEIPKSLQSQKGIAHLFLIILLLLGIGIGVFLVSQRTNLFPKASSSGVKLTLFPQATQISEGETFNLDVLLEPQAVTPAAVEVHLKYDSKYLEATKIQAATFYPNILKPGEITNNIASITLGNDLINPKTGSGIIATVAFKVLQPSSGPTQISFEQSTKASIFGQTDTSSRVADLTPASVTINSKPQDASAKLSLNPATTTLEVGKESSVQILVQNDADLANLFIAKLNFDPLMLEVTKVDTQSSFISNWADQSIDNISGKVSLVGGVPSPGYKTAGSPQTLATIYIKSKKSGAAKLSFDGSSGIYRDSDNENILKTTTGVNLTVSGGSEVSDIPEVPLQEEQAGSTASGSCTITQGDWDTNSESVEEGSLIRLHVLGGGECDGREVLFDVKQDKGILADGEARNDPISVKFDQDNNITTTWVSEYSPNGPFGIFDPPKYYFEARIAGDSKEFKAQRKLQVKKLGAGQFRKGDGDRNGRVELPDLSVLLSKWSADRAKNPNNFIREVDLNEDGVVNTVDFSAITQILRVKGALSRGH